jgi:hypothetical protein
MAQKSDVAEEWIRQLEAMKRFHSAAALAKEYGPPPHKVRQGELEIWHYPLGVLGGMLYSVHIAVEGDEASQTYMAMEPSNASDTVRPLRPWWRFW